MKKNLTKKLVALLISALTLCTLFANIVCADEILPAYDEEITYSVTGPAVARRLNDDGTEALILGTAQAPTAAQRHYTGGTAAETAAAMPAVDDGAVLNGTESAMAMIGTDALLARMDPNTHRNDIDLDKPVTVRDHIDQTGDILLDLASNFVPYGGSIMNYIKSRSKKAEPSTGTETVINVVSDVLTEVLPAVAEPVVAIASGIVTTVVKWIFY